MRVFLVFLLFSVTNGQVFSGDDPCPHRFTCSDGRCLDPLYFCDGADDCLDWSDEVPATDYYNATNSIPCRRYWDYASTPIRNCLLPMSQSAKKGMLCEIDSCAGSGFLCDTGRCIKRSRFCDYSNDCGDGSDERNQSSDRNCEFGLGSSECLLPDQFICDQKRDCVHGIDECLCTRGTPKIFLDNKCFRCLRKPRVIVPVEKLCDGNIDCPDLSDECLCDVKIRPQICDNIQWGNENSVELIPQVKIFCNEDKNETLLEVDKLCDNRERCDVIQDLRCNIQTPPTEWYYCEETFKYVRKCDHIIECPTRLPEEECECDGQKIQICGEIERRYPYYGYKLKDGFFLSARIMCNGYVSHPLRLDELNCPGWFDCDNTMGDVFRVHPDKICDGVEDCTDGSDEDVCPPFGCGDGGSVKYLETNQVCDGTPNCAKGSDECEERCINSIFSDTKKMIKEGWVQTIVWILSLTALIGNAIVMGFTIRDLAYNRGVQRESRRRDKLTKMLILNLSISDTLVGVYTLSIAIMNSVQSGSYCLIDNDWRSSGTCAAIGAILVIGSQNSVFTMLLITFYRVRATSRIIYYPSIKKYFVTVVIIWMVSIALAGIPEIPYLEDYFVDNIWYENNGMFSTIDHSRLYDMPYWLLMMNRLSNRTEPISNLHSWTTLQELITEMNPNFTVGRKYGFYSTHTVCLPTFFPNRKTDTAWWYSFLLIFINTVSFLAMLGGYLKIYKSATSENQAVHEDERKRREKRMQLRVFRVIITDALCWLPVCIMGFVQLAGAEIPKDAYLPVALMIIPINSSANPFLYSPLPDIIWRKIKLAARHVWRPLRGTRQLEVSRPETEEDKAVQKIVMVKRTSLREETENKIQDESVLDENAFHSEQTEKKVVEEIEIIEIKT